MSTHRWSWRSYRRWAGLVWVGLQALPVWAGIGPLSPESAVVQVWQTDVDPARRLAPQPPLALGRAAALSHNISVDPGQRFQEMVGFGAAVTDASAWLIQHRLTPEQRQAVLRELFAPAPAGLGLGLTRVTIGASDFSLRHYSLDDVPTGQSDPELTRFSLAPMQAEVLPVLRQARALNPQLQIMGSTWSAPAWMKTNQSLIQGSLRPDAYSAFAAYLNRFADAMQAQGLPLFALTLQNEPHFEPKDYPGMRLDPSQRAQLVQQALGPVLAGRQQRVKLLEWDHNWDEPNAPLEVLANAAARRYLDGVAWHCYAGEVSAQSRVHDAYPELDTYFTECSGGEWKPHWAETFPWFVRHLIIGSTRHWAKGVLLWNLALDENHGPHLGGCEDCRGVITIDSHTGAVTRNLEYYALAHVSRFVRPGAHRIASSTQADGLETVAFQNADDGSLVLLVLNDANQTLEFSVSIGEQRFYHQLPAASVATFVWPAAR